MQRVNLGKPYEEYIHKMVDSGYYASASEVIRDALRSKMEINSIEKVKTLAELVHEGLIDVVEGKLTPYNENFWGKVDTQAKLSSKNTILEHIKP
jgi:putative addiction module CopG family antidote